VLSVPPAYVLLAPLCNMLDALSLLSSRQHSALLGTVVLALLAWRGMRARHGRPGRVLRDIAMLCAAIPILALGVYIVCTMVPRPMVALTVTDPDLVVVDFHSHTNSSWDGRKGFTAERNREWHRAGGWNAAYLTDHMAFQGAALGMAGNPRRAGDGTTLLPAVECRGNGTHLLVLGLTPADVAVLNTAQRDRRVRLPHDPGHAVIQTIPANRARVEARVERRTRVGELVGIELSDGSPYGLDQSQRERVPLLAFAESRNVAVVSGSNNHGWTYAPVAWSLLRIPAWRELTPDALDSSIRELLRREGRHAVTVVERHAPDPGPTSLGLAATLPAVAWHMLATLTTRERVSWVAWIWGLALAAWCVKGRRPVAAATVPHDRA
jgi:hypothetical protein